MPQKIVMKFGGTSLADKAHIVQAATHIAERAKNYNVVVVVSAMGSETDRLARLAGENFDSEYDVILSTGEQISAALVAKQLQSQGIKARSFMGWQVPIKTNSKPTQAGIESVGCIELEAAFSRGEVPVVAGFQGVDKKGLITTLGRGGSDISAVAIAAAIKAECCEIYTDVDGVFTADPQIVEKANCLAMLSYEEMIELASLGARVLQTRSVSLAAANKVEIKVLQSARAEGTQPGTIICAEENMENQEVSGIAHSRSEAKITLSGLADRPGIAAKVFSPLSQAGILVDMIMQTSSLGNNITDMTFTLDENDLTRAITLLKERQNDIGYEEIDGDNNVAKISVVGIGMRTQTGIADIMFRTLSQEVINIQAISTSEIKISVLVEEAQMEKAVRVLHSAYGLDKNEQ